MKSSVLRQIAGKFLIFAVIFWSAIGVGDYGFNTDVRAQTSTPIGQIVVEGNQRIEVETILSYLTVQAGDAPSDSQINENLKTLFATGLFADVAIQRRGSDLVIEVTENPIINRIAFEGNRRIDDEALSAEVQLRPRVVFTRARVQSDVQRLVEVYRRSGRFSTTIEPKVIQLPQNRVDLVFEINEGSVSEIRRIRFVGNRSFSDSRLRREISTKESRWYRFLSSDDSYDPDRLSFDRELLRRFYLSEGFADARVSSAVAELTPDGEEFFITFTVEEGEIYNFGEIRITTELENVNIDELQSFLEVEQGEQYNSELIEKDIDKLSFELGRQGYAFVEVRPNVDRDTVNRTIGLTYAINEGRRVYVERINITGNVRTLDEVIRREFRIVEGDAFNTAKIQRSRSRIRGLGFFNRVDVKQQPGSADDRVVIDVNVEERSTGELSFGAGYSTTEAVIGDVSIRERNLLGRGQDLSLSLSVSSQRQEIDLSFTEPYFWDLPIAAGFDLFNQESDFQSRSSFDQSSTGLTLRAGFDITERLRQTLRYNFRRDQITNVQSSASRSIRETEGTTYSSSIGYRLTYDGRDDPLEPMRGFITSLGQDVAGLGGDVRNLRTTFRHTHYFPLFWDIVSSFGLNAGYIFGFDQDVRIDQRFFLGGSSFRGFEPGGIGPRDTVTDDSLGGNLYYVGTAALRFPVGLPEELGILGHLFADVGTLYDVDVSGAEIFDSSNLRFSAGVGLSWRSPFGPIQLDFTRAFVKEAQDEPEIFRFSFGTRF